jgi:hypothetical protein
MVFGRPDPEPPGSVEWHAFWEWFRREWQQGEHVSLIGPTQTGKTTMGLAILKRRTYRVVIGTKKSDPVLSRLIREGEYEDVPAVPVQADRIPRAVIWPRHRRIGDAVRQRQIIERALEEMFAAGKWTVFADEVSYLCRDLGLGNVLRTLWQQGASDGVTVVAATQRPAWVPLDLYSAPTHLFLWRTNDEQDLRRIGGLNGLSPKVVRQAVSQLDVHEALYVNTRRGHLWRTRYRKPTTRRLSA